MKVLKFDRAIYNTRQLFNAYDADLKDNEQQLKVYKYPCEDLKKNSYLKGTSNIYSDNYGKGSKAAEKIQKLLKVGLIHLLRAGYVKIEDVHLEAF